MQTYQYQRTASGCRLSCDNFVNFSLACLIKTWSWFLLRAGREIMMHASNDETVLLESKCGGIRGVHFSQSCNSIFQNERELQPIGLGA